MSWECCDSSGQCQRGHGCPAGGACHGAPGCKDTQCPGHPGVARVGKRKPSQAGSDAAQRVRRVQLMRDQSPMAAYARKRLYFYLCLAVAMVFFGALFAAGASSLQAYDLCELTPESAECERSFK